MGTAAISAPSLLGSEESLLVFVDLPVSHKWSIWWRGYFMQPRCPLYLEIPHPDHRNRHRALRPTPPWLPRERRRNRGLRNTSGQHRVRKFKVRLPVVFGRQSLLLATGGVKMCMAPVSFCSSPQSGRRPHLVPDSSAPGADPGSDDVLCRHLVDCHAPPRFGQVVCDTSILLDGRPKMHEQARKALAMVCRESLLRYTEFASTHRTRMPRELFLSWKACEYHRF